MAMIEYCSDDDVRKRLTTQGRKFLADKNRDGAVTAPEVADTIAEGIEEAGSIIDTHLCARYGEPATIRAQRNMTLKRLAIHIAVYHIISTGGRESMPGPIQDAYDKAIETLEAFRDGSANVPGLTAMLPVYGPGLTTRTPRVARPF